MRMMDELKPLYLYSAKKKVYPAIDEKDKRHNSAILLLTPDIATSSKLMNLPYLYNPNLFTSFYVDRNVMAYIDTVGEDVLDFDEQEEEIVSEAMLIPWTKKTKIKFNDNTSIMDRHYAEKVFCASNISKSARSLGISKVPEEINITVHPTIMDLQKDVPKGLMNVCNNKIFSYTKENEVHILSKLAYDENSMAGPYDMYLYNELLYCIMANFNNNLRYIPVKAISNAASGLVKWKKDFKDHRIEEIKSIDNLSKVANKMLQSDRDRRNITKYLNTADLGVFARYATSVVMKDIHKVIFEAELSYFERQNLLPSEFGIPEKRKYPLPNEEHVISAIRMFNHCDPDDEEQLAEAIIKRIERFGMKDVKVGVGNRFYKYWKKYNEKKENKHKHRHEAVILESFINTDYEDILKICSHLSKEEFGKVSFYDTYRDSQFVIKRIIHRVDGEPAGFLDVYQFPSKPSIAQVVIAVDDRYRGQGIADAMVKEMLNADLAKQYGFEVFYWTAHPDNQGSISLALKNGFDDTGSFDKYGRKIFIRIMNNMLDTWKDVVSESGLTVDDDYVMNESSIVSHDLALFTEADNEKMYSQRIRKYLYNERLKNNKAVYAIYDNIKATNPWIKRTHVNLKLYKKFNIFIDLSYYNKLFLEKNNFKLDKAVDFYFNFMNRLINNKDINAEYKIRTVFIPVDQGVWGVQQEDLFDYRRGINPISVMIRLMRTNPALLKKEWGNKNIIFVGSRGYFTIDFSKVEMKDLVRIKTNLKKLGSLNEKIEDDYEIDDLGDSDNGVGQSDSNKATTANIINKIETGTGITIDNISSTKKQLQEIIPANTHLRISNDAININRDNVNQNNGVVIISIDPDGPDGFSPLRGSLLSMASKIDTYCIPEDK